jgi:hypothetical protein
VDYDNKSEAEAAQLFFKKVQNKMLWGVAGRAVAKNDLSPDEIEVMDRIMAMYLDYAEDQAPQRRRNLTMRDWEDTSSTPYCGSTNARC